VACLQLTKNFYPFDLSMFDQSYSYAGDVIRGHPGGDIAEEGCFKGILLGQGRVDRDGYREEEQGLFHVNKILPKKCWAMILQGKDKLYFTGLFSQA